jgi:hypothetical protein
MSDVKSGDEMGSVLPYGIILGWCRHGGQRSTGTPWPCFASRERAVSRARLMVAWLGREVGRIPVAPTARFFGRDTSVMIKGLNRLDAAMQRDRSLRGKLAMLRSETEKSAHMTHKVRLTPSSYIRRRDDDSVA